MTRAQAQVVLDVIAVSVVRLKVDVGDAQAWHAGMIPRDTRSPRDEFIAQWDATYRGELAFSRNPPVWRIEFSPAAGA